MGATYRIAMQPPEGEVHLGQGPFKTQARRALHRDGWTESFDKLAELLADQP